MLVNPKNHFDVEKADAYYRKLRSGDRPFELKARNPGRTIQQNRYLHVLLGYFASEYGYTLDEVKVEFFKKLVNGSVFYATRLNKRGQTVRYLRSTSDLDTAEMTLCIDRFRNYSAANGLYLPAPHEQEALLYAEQQMESMNEYL